MFFIPPAPTESDEKGLQILRALEAECLLGPRDLNLTFRLLLYPIERG